MMRSIFAILLFVLAGSPLNSQTLTKAEPEPSSPAASIFQDRQYGVTFHVPTAWNLTHRDAEQGTFALDVRTAPPHARMRGLASIAFNPYPRSTFSSAFFYFSVTPRSTEQECRSQATAQAPRRVTPAQIGGATFAHGYDEHGTLCIESRDEIYTSLRNKACYRFDLVINNFCGGEVSGVRDITAAELDDVRRRMESILNTVSFDGK